MSAGCDTHNIDAGFCAPGWGKRKPAFSLCLGLFDEPLEALRWSFCSFVLCFLLLEMDLSKRKCLSLPLEIIIEL